MQVLFVIGLPGAVQRRLEARLRGTPRISSARMEMSKKGEPVLVPHPGDAVRCLREAFDGVEDAADLFVVHLPYAPAPHELDDELEALASLGAPVYRPVPGSDRWPVYSRRKKLDQEFLDGLYFSLMSLTPADGQAPPSERFTTASQRTGRFIIAEGAIATVDDIAAHRHDFIRRAVEALEEIAIGQPSGSYDAFFAGKGLTFASSGGITAKVEAWRKGTMVVSQTSNNHLKQGDGTSRVAAVRLYFDTIQDGDHRFVVVLYAGPHPDTDVSRRVDLPDSSP